jgi:DNA-binding beta-propeller fold protein YncE
MRPINQGVCAVRTGLFLFLLGCLPVAAQQAPIPAPTQLPSNPFFVKKSWPIGGSGNWDYITLDPAARRLYIAHDHAVQVVDVDSGSVVGEVQGFREAHAIALDDENTKAYVSDGPVSAIKVFDRQSLKVENNIPVGCSPRSIVYEPAAKLVFAVCGAEVQPPRSTHPSERPEQPQVFGFSHVIAIDTSDKDQVLADLSVPGDLRVVAADGSGQVYITAGASQVPMSRNGSAPNLNRTIPSRIIVLESSTLVNAAHRWFSEQQKQESDGPARFVLDADYSNDALAQFLQLPPECLSPQGLVVDHKNSRLFAACDGQKLLVLDAVHGHTVAALTTGPGDDVIGYDPEHELIYSANGGGYGSLTIIQQDANTDSYAVVQNLPTLERARTLAVDSSSGSVYLVTDLHGVDLTKSGGIGTLHSDPVQGSFQVLVVGH